VEVLHTVLGLKARDLRRTVDVEVAGVVGRIPLPHLVLKAKLANSALLSQDGRQDVVLKLKNPVESSFRKAIKNAKDNPDAGDYYTLEAPFAVTNKKPQGLIIFVNQESQIIASFRFRYSTINKKALEWVKILKCDFREMLEYNASMSLKGIELDRTIEDLLGEEK
jgi:hypothetical protein